MLDFREFLDCLVKEELHPELHQIVTSTGRYGSKQSLIAKKIKDLTKKGLRTGIEGNMPKGSARAYLKHDTPHKVMIDGQQHEIPTGTKVAITAALDKHHNHADHDGMRLGALQNHAEGGDHWVNSRYRTLTHEKTENGTPHFKTNEDGIFPPLIDHDHVNNEWSHVGHARDLGNGEFNKLTANKEYPKGISHRDFCEALERRHNDSNGKYHVRTPKVEQHLDHIEQHPLVQNFLDYHGNTGNPPYDYRQKKNLGVWEHPNGTKHIVARDHGFDSTVMHAYQKARENSVRKARGW